MPRHVVQRTFFDDLCVPITEEAAKAFLDGRRPPGLRRHLAELLRGQPADRTYCLVDGSDPETIRHAAGRRDLPVDRITDVRVLDPHFYQ